MFSAIRKVGSGFQIRQSLRFYTTKYTKSHEWVRCDDGKVGVVGITDNAQRLLGDIVFVELPQVNSQFSSSEPCGVVESVKAASDIYAPVSGSVIEANPELESSPELINEDPMGDGWIYKVKLSNVKELDGMMDEAAYKKFVDSEH
ncbi:hypothetical protein CYY_003748 [Polysphondylium violaceum]|uniref:Glycine cleavage system H protein n=1 Tax=Polysphondylium violaceum TaxID=133409 RepID=A0A8J4PVU6_9MYCE|nr:hypothetical protein CYY_003748 [Polysphondylium violaceum]